MRKLTVSIKALDAPPFDTTVPPSVKLEKLVHMPYQKAHTRTFMLALFITKQKLEANQWSIYWIINKLWHNSSVEYHTAEQKNMKYMTTWINATDII